MNKIIHSFVLLLCIVSNPQAYQVQPIVQEGPYSNAPQQSIDNASSGLDIEPQPAVNDLQQPIDSNQNNNTDQLEQGQSHPIPQ